MRLAEKMPADTVIAGRYKVLAVLRQDHTGISYKCMDETSGAEVVVTALRAGIADGVGCMEKINFCFQQVHKMNHPSFANVFALEQDASDGGNYLVSEFFPGEDLKNWTQRKKAEGKLTLDDLLPVVQQIAAALDHAHKQGLLCRDFNPFNILVDDSGKIKLINYGLSAAVRSCNGSGGVLDQCSFYMAPEQWRGKQPVPQTDQYSLAVVIYEILAGNLPFECAETAILREGILNETADDIPGLAAGPQNALKRAMAKNPAERFLSCTDFITALSKKSTLSLPASAKKMAFKQSQEPVESETQDTVGKQEYIAEEQREDILQNADGATTRTECALQILLMLLILLHILFPAVQFLAQLDDNYQSMPTIMLWTFPVIFQMLLIFPALKRLKTMNLRPLTWLLILPYLGALILIVILFVGKEKRKPHLEYIRLQILIAIILILGGLAVILPYPSLTVQFVLAHNNMISHVKIPRWIYHVPAGVFYQCTNITEITFADSVESIGTDAFTGCNVQRVKIGSGLRAISPVFFKQNIESETPAFDVIGAMFMRNVEFDVSEKNPVYASDRYGALIHKTEHKLIHVPTTIRGKYEVPMQVLSIADGAFYDCKEISAVVIHDKVTNIGNHAFRNCEKLTEISLPESLSALGENAFANCYALRKIEMADSNIVSIENMTFYNCTNLQEIKLPLPVKSIGEYAFYGCSSLKKLKIPRHVTKIGRLAFDSGINIVLPSYRFKKNEISQWFDCDNPEVDYYRFGH